MFMRHHAQRQHIIFSLDALLYQLHTLSFILSPSIWSFLCRLVSQFQCSKPRDLDATAGRSLRFFFSNVLLFNASSLWYHATQGAAEGRAIVLDFVGLGYVPSKLQLLGLDFLIILLQLVLTTIAYETSLLEHSTESDDMLLPIPHSSSELAFTPSMPSITSHPKSHTPDATSSYVVDLRLASIVTRLRNPPPPPRAGSSDASLPLPNTTPWPLPAGMRMLIRTNSQIRRTSSGNDDNSQIPGALAA